MEAMELSRRGLILGGACLVAAPAIVRASSLMPVKAEKQILIKSYERYSFGWYDGRILAGWAPLKAEGSSIPFDGGIPVWNSSLEEVGDL
jgi:hypothetical protein